MKQYGKCENLIISGSSPTMAEVASFTNDHNGAESSVTSIQKVLETYNDHLGTSLDKNSISTAH